MTPFKLRPRFPSSNSPVAGLNFDDELMVSSPPRAVSALHAHAHAHARAPISKQQLPPANLFGDAPPPSTVKKQSRRRYAAPTRATATTAATVASTTTVNNKENSRNGSSSNTCTDQEHNNNNIHSDSNSSILRPLDLNAEATMTSSSLPSTPRHQHRKRHSDSTAPAGREDVAWEDSDEDMFTSPVKQQQQHPFRASPNSYRTLDGRTVTSKNPFSPFTPMDTADEDAAYSPQQNMGTAPTMPESFSRQTPAASPQITLSQRSPSLFAASAGAGAQTFFGPNKCGFPDQQGRYSFTGSPIEELDTSLFMDHSAAAAAKPRTGSGSGNNKIRRLNLENDVATRQGRHQLYVHTEHEESMDNSFSSSTSGKSSNSKNQYRRQAPAKDGNDNISPTDVFSFFPGSAAPPTPVKAGRNGGSSYTPLRIMHAPTTPSRLRRRGQQHDDDDDDSHLYLPSSSEKQQQQIQSRFHTDFDVIGQLGDGSFGTVYKCLSRLDGCMYAVKAAKRKAKGQADRDRMLKEVYALAALSDQADTAAFHIVRYHQAWMEENRLYIQTELCSCTLQDEIERGTLVSIPRRYKLLRELCVALEFIHRHGMVHLDIKPENIFVKNDQYKLGDFGLVHKSVTSDGAGSNDDVEEGDSRYMSMELLSGEFKDLTKSDIFSMGATMYEICLGRQLPMDGQEWQDIRSGSLQPLANPDTPFAMELIVKEMMHPDPDMRPHPAQLLKKNELLSDEQKQLLAEKQKVFAVNMALALQTERMKKLTPPRPGGLMRANTWNGSLPKWL